MVSRNTIRILGKDGLVHHEFHIQDDEYVEINFASTREKRKDE